MNAILKLFAAAVLLAMAHTATAATVGPVTDDLGVIRIAKGAPIQIGAYWVLSGADTALGLTARPSAELALEHGPVAEEGARITESELTETYEVARNTARRALAVLREDGLIMTVPQRGSYVL